MLVCCQRLCSREYDALTRIGACYPTDGRPDPVAARVRELIHWGLHDLSRFDSIHESILERIRHDISRRTPNSASVGVKILGRLLKEVAELNRSLSQGLSSAIVKLIKTRQPEFLALAREGIGMLLANTQPRNFGQSVKGILKEYVPLCDDAENMDAAFEGLSVILESASLDAIPLSEVLEVIKKHLNSHNNARQIVIALAHAAAPLTLGGFSEALLAFFTEGQLWGDELFLNNLIITLMTEMKDSCGPPFFRLWLEQLLPTKQVPEHLQSVVKVAVRLTEELPPTKLLSQTQIDSLTTVYMFVLKLNKDYGDRAAVMENALTLAHSIAAHFANTELAKVAHRQLWEALPVPVGTEDAPTEYSDETIIQIFKFTTAFNDAISARLTAELVIEALKRVFAFLSAFSAYSGEVLGAILDHFKQLYVSFPTARLSCACPFFFALQKSLKGADRPCAIRLHTFILCGLFAIAGAGAPDLVGYLNEIAERRRRMSPPMIDFHLEFVAQYVGKPKSPSKKRKQKDEFPAIKKSVAISKIPGKRQRREILANVTVFFAGPDDDDGDANDGSDIDAEDDAGPGEALDIPQFHYRTESHDGPALDADVDPQERAERRTAVLDRIKTLSSDWRSVLN
jgi:hypothetical protein